LAYLSWSLEPADIVWLWSMETLSLQELCVIFGDPTLSSLNMKDLLCIVPHFMLRLNSFKITPEVLCMCC